MTRQTLLRTVRGITRRMIGRFRGEDGESSIGLVLLVPIVLLAGFGLTYDWAGKVRASEEAVVIAQQAARAGANAGVAGELGSTTGQSTLDTVRARQVAQNFLIQAGADGTVTATTQEVTVTATVTYQPQFLPVGPLEGTGEGTAELRRNVR